jgi:4-oxalmesaconate hydratase
MIIDVHGHFTTAPSQLDAYRGRQLSALNRPSRGRLLITDDELRISLIPVIQQLDDRGIASLIFSPRASGMGHEIGSFATSRYWSEHNNDLIYRATQMYPGRLIPAGQLPQSPGVTPASCIDELERIVTQLGFVGVNVNPDVSGGAAPFTPPISDPWWTPLWEKVVELDVPVMLHASSTVNPALHLNGSHYTNSDSAVAFDLGWSDLLERLPELKIVVPHGGGSIPFNFNRIRALHIAAGKRPLEEALRQFYFDTAVYDRDSMEMLIRKIGADNLLFASEPFGTAKPQDPATGKAFDDTVSFVNDVDWLQPAEKEKILSGNARRLYGRAAFGNID